MGKFTVKSKIKIFLNNNKSDEAKAAFIKEVEEIFSKVSNGDKWQNKISLSDFEQNSVIKLYSEYCSQSAMSCELISEFNDHVSKEAQKNTSFANSHNENLQKLMVACETYALRKSVELKDPQVVGQKQPEHER